MIFYVLDHILQTPEPSAKCTGLLGFALTKVEKDAVLNLHNKLRKVVADGKETRGNPGPQPAAKYMPDLVIEYDIHITHSIIYSQYLSNPLIVNKHNFISRNGMMNWNTLHKHGLVNVLGDMTNAEMSVRK